jgi:hypothetical protein
MSIQQAPHAGRAIVVIDSSLGPASLGWAKQALRSTAHLLAVSVVEPPPVGLAMLFGEHGKPAQLQVRQGHPPAVAGPGSR